MKKHRSPLQIFGFVLLVVSTIAFVASMVICYIGEFKGILYVFISLFLFYIGYVSYNKGKIKTENFFGNDNENENEDENIYKDTANKD